MYFDSLEIQIMQDCFVMSNCPETDKESPVAACMGSAMCLKRNRRDIFFYIMQLVSVDSIVRVISFVKNQNINQHITSYLFNE